MLKDLLTEKTIKLNVDAKDWKEAVKKGGEPLVEHGYIEPRYIDAMIDTVNEVGPYIVIAPGIAMPHARPEDGVTQVCMSLITLTKPVEFGHEANDHNTHLEALSQLMNLFINQKYIDEILSTSNVNQVMQIIEKC